MNIFDLFPIVTINILSIALFFSAVWYRERILDRILRLVDAVRSKLRPVKRVILGTCRGIREYHDEQKTVRRIRRRTAEIMKLERRRILDSERLRELRDEHIQELRESR